MGQDTLLHGETLLIVPATDSDHITLPFFTQRVSSNFCGHTLLVEGTKFSFIIHFNELLAASGGTEMFSFILKQPTGSEAPRKRAGRGFKTVHFSWNCLLVTGCSQVALRRSPVPKLFLNPTVSLTLTQPDKKNPGECQGPPSLPLPLIWI